MKLRRLHILLSLILVLSSLLFLAPAASASALSDVFPEMLQKYPLTSQDYEYSCGDRSLGAEFFYSHALLFQDNQTLSPDLVKASMALSARAYDTLGEDIRDLLKSMGFVPEDNRAIYHKVYSQLTVDDFDHVGYTIATASVSHPVTGEEYLIYCVPIQGTSTALEWFSNFNIGFEEEHEGFKRATLEIADHLVALLDEDGMDPAHRILWTTGHSRGGACANLLAARFSKTSKAFFASENVVGYTFAAPAVSKKADPELTNIFNFVNPGDLVPLFPMPEWDYARHGKTYDLDTSAAHFRNFSQRFTAETYKTYNGEVTNDNFRTLLSEISKNEDAQMILDLIAWTLGGYDETAMLQIIDKHVSAGDVAWEMLGKVFEEHLPPIDDILSLLDLLLGHDEQNEYLLKWVTQAYEDTASMDEETFQAYLKLHSDQIQKLQNITDVTVTHPQNLYAAKEILEDNYKNLKRCANCVESAAELLSGGPGKLLEPHVQGTYTLWINSMFYGYKGWAGNTEITSVPLDSSYFSIGDQCFSNCTRVTSARIPEGIRVIGDSAFYGCSNITELTLPDSIRVIGNSAFSGCTGIPELLLPDVLFRIGEYTFANCTGILSATMPADLQFGMNAFSGTTNAETIRYTPGASGIMRDRVSDYLKDDYYRNTLEHQSAASLQSIVFDEGVTHIADYLCYFDLGYDRTMLKSVILPSTLESIGTRAFHACVNLETPEWPENLTTIGSQTFYKCLKLTSHPTTLTAYPVSCFSNCTGITSIVIPDTISEIEDYAFANCTGAVRVTMPADLRYDVHSFSGTNNVETIRYTPGATGIMPDRAYDVTHANTNPLHFQNSLEHQNPDSLRRIEFAEGIKHIADYLCYYYNAGGAPRPALEQVTFPSTLESIGQRAFYYCNNLATPQWPNSLTTIGSQTFSNCKTLTSHPTTLTAFPTSCFYGCTGLTHIVIPDTISEIGDNAFADCTGATRITMPADLQYEKNSFTGTCNVETICYTPGATGSMPDRALSSSSPGLFFQYSLEHQNLDSLQKIVFEEGVRHIADYLCYYYNVGGVPRPALKQVTFPSTLESIGKRAFFYCTNLATPQWPSSLTTIGSEAFYSCTSLTSHPTTLTAFPTSCFSGCSGITHIVIPDTVSEIGNNAFANCTGATRVTMPADVQYGTSSFSGVTNVETICYTPGATGIMPDRSTNYASPYYTENSLEYRSAGILQSIEFAEGVKHIAGYLCYSSGSAFGATLKSLTLPSTLESIGTRAFYKCTALEPLTFPGNAPTIGENAFYNVTTTCYYPPANETWTSDILQDYGGTLTWIRLSCTGEHSYGAPIFDWAEPGICQASAQCSTCSQALSIPCHVSSEVVLPTASQNGTVTYTASVSFSGTTYTDTMVITIAPGEHAPDSPWHTDSTRHWQVCVICETELHSADHTPGSPATQNTSRKCTVCGYILQLPLGLEWVLDTPGGSTWFSGYYAKVMEQYGSFSE